MQTFSDPDFFRPVTLTFPKALEPFIGSSVSGWQVREERKNGDGTQGFMGQAGLGTSYSHSFLPGQSSIP